jgi:hypothetical protein
MNSRQVCTLLIGILIFVLTGLFPPVNRVHTVTVVNESTDSVETQEVRSEFKGYKFYFSLNHPPDGQEYRVSKMILAAEWLLLLIVVRSFIKAFRDKPSLPQAPIFHRP